MSLTTKDFPALTEYLDSVYKESSKNAIDENAGINQIFDISSTETLTHLHTILHGMGGMQATDEDGEFVTLGNSEGDSATWTQNEYGAKIKVTKKMRIFDRTAAFTNAGGLVRSAVDASWSNIYQSLCDMLSKGHATSYVDVYGKTVSALTPDGVALFSAAHTAGGVTYSNIINDGTNNNPSFSREAVVRERANAARYKDPKGSVRPNMLDTVIVPPALEDLAYRTLYSDKVAGTANNDMNPSFVKGMKIIVSPYLGFAADGTDCSARWYMCNSKMVGESLKALFKQKPMLSAPTEADENNTWIYKLDAFYTSGLGFFPYIRGSAGTNS